MSTPTTARERHRIELKKRREAEKRRSQRVRVALISAVVVALVAVSSSAVYGISRLHQPAPEIPLAAPSGIPTDQTYYVLGAPEGSSDVTVDIWADFICPSCGQFHDVNGAYVDSIIQDESVTVRLHTRTFLDLQSSTRDYSTRAAGAFACVYDEDPDLALDYQDALFENQPSEGSALTNRELSDLAVGVGAPESVSSCIGAKTYSTWLHDVVEKEAKEKTTGTPYILVNGTKFENWNTEGALQSTVDMAASDARNAA